MEQVYQKGSTGKIDKKIDHNIYLRADLSERQKKLLTLKEKMQTGFLIMAKIHFFLKFKCYKCKYAKTCMSQKKLQIKDDKKLPDLLFYVF